MANGTLPGDTQQGCPGFFVQITVTGVLPAHALDISRWCQHAGRLLHLDFQSYTGDFHFFEVGVAHGLTLLASSIAQCWGDLGTWNVVWMCWLRLRSMPLSMNWMPAMTLAAPTWLLSLWPYGSAPGHC